ncbi:MAG: hypothetical protein K6G09_00955 [Treponema sp.]|nr:hypothetical protein [Treponema sp.]
MLFFEAICLITAFLTLITKNLPKVRKTAIADVYDALVSKRVYKEAYYV